MPYLPDGGPGYVAGSETSKAAAESMEDIAATMEAIVHELIRSSGENGLTCDEIEVLGGFTHQTASARCRKLKLRGWVRPNGVKRMTRQRRQADVLVAVKEPALEDSPTRLAELLVKLRIVVGQLRQEVPSVAAGDEAGAAGHELMKLGDELMRLGAELIIKV